MSIVGSARGSPLRCTVRHLVEQACSDVLRRFARAYGPYPLAIHEETAQRYQELDLYLRQSHGERDLESLGELTRNRDSTLKKRYPQATFDRPIRSLWKQDGSEAKQ